MTFNEIQGERVALLHQEMATKSGILWSNYLGNDLHGSAVTNQNQGAEPITSYYIMRFVLHAQFMDAVRNTKELSPKRPSVTYIWASKTLKGIQ